MRLPVLILCLCCICAPAATMYDLLGSQHLTLADVFTRIASVRGPCRGVIGLSTVCRQLADIISNSSCCTLQIHSGTVPGGKELPPSMFETPPKTFADVNLFVVTGAGTPEWFAKNTGGSPGNWEKWLGYRVGVWAWELAEYPDSWIQRTRFYDEIWVLTNFLKEGLTKHTDIPVKVPIFPIKRTDIPPITHPRSTWGLRDDQFVFFFNFDYNSFRERKNPDGLIEAFRRCNFTAKDNVVLVIKTSGVVARDKMSANKLNEKDLGSNVKLIQEEIEQDAFDSLLLSADCYVSLHRAEGLGYGMFEAMGYGKPVIGTGWSGNTDFMNEHNSFPVRYKLVKLERTVGPYTAGNYWADPDLDHAAQLMRYVFEHQQEAKLVGQRARAYMLENYSMERAAAWMKQQMDEIQQNPVKRSQTVMDLAPSFLGFVSPHPRVVREDLSPPQTLAPYHDTDGKRPFWSVGLFCKNSTSCDTLLQRVLAADLGSDLMEIYVSSEEAVVEAASVNVWTRVNKWLKTTKGIWISILQDGDVILPDFYSQFRAHLMAKEFASEQKLGLAFCAVKLLYGDKLAWAWITTTALVPEFLQKVTHKRVVGYQAQSVIKREVFEHVGLFRTDMNTVATLEMWQRIAVSQYSVLSVAKILLMEATTSPFLFDRREITDEQLRDWVTLVQWSEVSWPPALKASFEKLRENVWDDLVRVYANEVSLPRAELALAVRPGPVSMWA